MDRQAEREIAAGLRAGSRQAWLRLYDACAPSVWRNVARIMEPDSTNVADVVQETFLAAARSAGGFNPSRGTLGTWLWGIARKQVALFYRKNGRPGGLDDARRWWSSLDDSRLEWLAAETEAPPRILESKELATLVGVALAELSADHQMLLIAKYMEGVPAAQIAAEAGKSEQAIRSKLARARRAFRGAFLRTAGRGDRPEVRE